VLSSVQKQGTDQVVMTFKDQAVPYFFYIAGQVGIVPQHAWSNVSDPVKYDDKKPVGTGPFTVGQCTPQAITYTRNTNYWQKGKPLVDKVVYPAFTDNQPANLYLSQGKADWGGQFIPNIDSYYKAKDPSNNHYWFPPTNNVSIYINQTKSSLNNKTVRQALAFAVDRAKVSRDGEYGYEPPANQTGIITPTFDSWYDSAAAKKYDYRYDPAKAASLLDQAGYKKGSDGMLHGPDGKPLSLNIINVNGNTDWVASVNIIRDNLKQVGIDLQPANLSQQDYQSRLYNGDFDLAYGTPPTSGAPAPYYELRATLYSANSAPVGQAASSNFERWQSTATDQLFDSYAATTDSAEQHRLISQIEQTMLEDVPVIPVTEGVAWYQYSSKRFDGWPTKDNPYADPAPYAFPDWEVVLLNLQPK
jgi:peptide/nickel transport system substrate-binding protein